MALFKTQTTSPGPPISGQSFQAVGSTTTVKGTDLYVPDSRTLSDDPCSGSERPTRAGRGGLMLAVSLHSSPDGDCLGAGSPVRVGADRPVELPEEVSVAACCGTGSGDAATCAGGDSPATVGWNCRLGGWDSTPGVNAARAAGGAVVYFGGDAVTCRVAGRRGGDAEAAGGLLAGCGGAVVCGCGRGSGTEGVTCLGWRCVVGEAL